MRALDPISNLNWRSGTVEIKLMGFVQLRPVAELYIWLSYSIWVGKHHVQSVPALIKIIVGSKLSFDSKT